jgi:hypothetical protein
LIGEEFISHRAHRVHRGLSFYQLALVIKKIKNFDLSEDWRGIEQTAKKIYHTELAEFSGF